MFSDPRALTLLIALCLLFGSSTYVLSGGSSNDILTYALLGCTAATWGGLIDYRRRTKGTSWAQHPAGKKFLWMEAVALVGILGTGTAFHAGIVDPNNVFLVAIGLAAFVEPLLTARYFFERSSYGETTYSKSGFQLRLAFLVATMSATIGCTLAPIPDEFMTVFLFCLSVRMIMHVTWYAWKWCRSLRPRQL